MLRTQRRTLAFRESYPCHRRTRFLCLIPAYNESTVIGNPGTSFLNQRYPSSIDDVVVVHDGTDDNGVYDRMSRCVSPFGDGSASVRAVGILLREIEGYPFADPVSPSLTMQGVATSSEY